MAGSRKPYKTDPFGNISYGSLDREDAVHFIYSGLSEFPFVIESIGVTKPDRDYFIERKHNDYYVLEYIVSGEGYLTNNDISYNLKPGNVYILKPGDRHRYSADKKNPYKKIWINFISPFFGEVLKAYRLHDITVFESPECEILFNQLIDISKTSIVSDNISFEVGNILFSVVTKLALGIAEYETKVSLAKQIKEYLDFNVYKSVNVKDLSNHFYLSKEHLIREFKKTYNMTPYDYHLNNKILAAKKMLAFSDKTITQISETLSFIDEHYFSNFFKSKTGFSPSAYRKEHENK